MAQTLSNTALSMLKESQIMVTTSGSARGTSGRSYAPRLVNALLRDGYIRKTALHYFTGGLRLTPLAIQALAAKPEAVEGEA